MRRTGAVGDLPNQTAAEIRDWGGRAIRHAKQDVRVTDVRLPEHAASSVSGALGLGAGGSLQVVDETSHGAALHEGGTPRGDAFVVDRPGRGASWRQRVVDDGQPLVEQCFPDLARQRRAALEHGLSRQRLFERQYHRGETGWGEHDGQRALRRRDDREGCSEAGFDGANEHLEIGIRGEVGADILIVDHQHVIAGNPRDVRGHADAGGTVLAACAGGIADRRVGDLALDGDVDLTAWPRQPLDQEAPHADQLGERSVRGAVEKRGDGG